MIHFIKVRTGCPFCRVSEFGSYCGTSWRTQDFNSIRLPFQGYRFWFTGYPLSVFSFSEYVRFLCLNSVYMFRASLCPSSGAQEYYTVVAAYGILCCGFQVAGLVWSWGLCVRFAGCCNKNLCYIQLAFYFHILTTMHGQNHIKSVYSCVSINMRINIVELVYNVIKETESFVSL